MPDQVKEKEKEFFDQFDREGGYDRFTDSSYEAIFSLIKEHVGPKPGDRSLDMGCGTGVFTKRISDSIPGLQIIGIDISSGCISRASKLHSEIQFQVGDVEKTEFPSSSFDLIFLFGILHHFPDFEKVAAEVSRLLKVGGQFFSFDPHHYNPAFWTIRSKSSPFYSSVGVTENERLLTKKELKDVFGRNGFKVEAQVLSGLSFTYVESDFGKKLLGLYNFFDGILAKTHLAQWIGAWVVGWGRKEH